MAEVGRLRDLLSLLEAAVADMDQALGEGDVEQAGDHALTVEELAREFQEKAA